MSCIMKSLLGFVTNIQQNCFRSSELLCKQTTNQLLYKINRWLFSFAQLYGKNLYAYP